MPTWLITGCSSGLGHALAHAVLSRGWNAVVTARDPARVQNLISAFPDSALAVALDVSNREQVKAAIASAEAKFGGIDVLVNNAGYGYRAAVEEADEADVEELFASNFFGAVSMIKAVLPGMRARRSGTIVNLSSIAAKRTGPGSGYYAATKCTLEGLSAGLRSEVESLGIRVIVVEPGAFRTDFSGRSLMQSRTPIVDYAETAGRRRIESDKTHGTQPGDPARAADIMIKAIEDTTSPNLILLGSDAVKIVTASLERDLAAVEAWKWESNSTDFPE